MNPKQEYAKFCEKIEKRGKSIFRRHFIVCEKCFKEAFPNGAEEVSLGGIWEGKVCESCGYVFRKNDDVRLPVKEG